MRNMGTDMNNAHKSIIITGLLEALKAQLGLFGGSTPTPKPRRKSKHRGDPSHGGKLVQVKRQTVGGHTVTKWVLPAEADDAEQGSLDLEDKPKAKVAASEPEQGRDDGYDSLPKKAQGIVAPYLSRMDGKGLKFAPLSEIGNRDDLSPMLGTGASRRLNAEGWALVRQIEDKPKGLSSAKRSLTRPVGGQMGFDLSSSLDRADEVHAGGHKFERDGDGVKVTDPDGNESRHEDHESAEKHARGESGVEPEPKETPDDGGVYAGGFNAPLREMLGGQTRVRDSDVDATKAAMFIMDRAESVAAWGRIDARLSALHDELGDWSSEHIDSVGYDKRFNRKKAIQALQALRDKYESTAPPPVIVRVGGLHVETVASSAEQFAEDAVWWAFHWRMAHLTEKDRGRYASNSEQLKNERFYRGLNRERDRFNVLTGINRPQEQPGHFSKLDDERWKRQTEGVQKSLEDVAALPKEHHDLLGRAGTRIRWVIHPSIGGQLDRGWAGLAGWDLRTDLPLVQMADSGIDLRGKLGFNERAEVGTTLTHEVAHILDNLTAERVLDDDGIAIRANGLLEEMESMAPEPQAKEGLFVTRMKEAGYDPDTSQISWGASKTEWVAEAYRVAYRDGDDMKTVLQAGDFSADEWRSRVDASVNAAIERFDSVNIGGVGDGWVERRLAAARKHAMPITPKLATKVATQVIKDNPATKGQDMRNPITITGLLEALKALQLSLFGGEPATGAKPKARRKSKHRGDPSHGGKLVQVKRQTVGGHTVTKWVLPAEAEAEQGGLDLEDKPKAEEAPTEGDKVSLPGWSSSAHPTSGQVTHKSPSGMTVILDTKKAGPSRYIVMHVPPDVKGWKFGPGAVETDGASNFEDAARAGLREEASALSRLSKKRATEERGRRHNENSRRALNDFIKEFRGANLEPARDMAAILKSEKLSQAAADRLRSVGSSGEIVGGPSGSAMLRKMVDQGFLAFAGKRETRANHAGVKTIFQITDKGRNLAAEINQVNLGIMIEMAEEFGLSRDYDRDQLREKLAEERRELRRQVDMYGNRSAHIKPLVRRETAARLLERSFSIRFMDSSGNPVRGKSDMLAHTRLNEVIKHRSRVKLSKKRAMEERGRQRNERSQRALNDFIKEFRGANLEPARDMAAILKSEKLSQAAAESLVGISISQAEPEVANAGQYSGVQHAISEGEVRDGPSGSAMHWKMVDQGLLAHARNQSTPMTYAGDETIFRITDKGHKLAAEIGQAEIGLMIDMAKEFGLDRDFDLVRAADLSKAVRKEFRVAKREHGTRAKSVRELSKRATIADRLQIFISRFVGKRGVDSRVARMFDRVIEHRSRAKLHAKELPHLSDPDATKAAVGGVVIITGMSRSKVSA